MDTQINVIKGITNITGLRTKTKEIVERVRTSQRPMLVTSGGEAAVIILDARAYQQMVDYIEELEAEEIIRLANDAEQGGSYELEEGIRVFEERADAIIAAQRAIEQGQRLRCNISLRPGLPMCSSIRVKLRLHGLLLIAVLKPLTALSRQSRRACERLARTQKVAR